jgi:hypothetical protein
LLSGEVMLKPLFERRHFKKIASIIANMPTHSVRLRTTREEVASAFAAGLRGTNPNFDSGKFIAAALEEED